MLRRILFLTVALWGEAALAQQPVIIYPNPRATTNASGAIAVTDTFQSIFSADDRRAGCQIQNTGTNPMYVFFGPIASATKAKSIKIAAAGAIVECNSAGTVHSDQVSITGTQTETFYAAQQ